MGANSKLRNSENEKKKKKMFNVIKSLDLWVKIGHLIEVNWFMKTKLSVNVFTYELYII